MNLAAARPLGGLEGTLVIARREIRDQLRDWRILTPILILTLFFPLLMNFTAHQAVVFVSRYGANIIAERLIPFLLMVVGFFPISISLVIALESFAGERERLSLEPLLATPLTDSQLYLGKLIASLVAPLVAAYVGIFVYLGGLAVRIGWTPPAALLIQVLLLTTAQAVVMVSAAVVISSQATSVRAANLLASFIIVPVSQLILGESLIMFWGRYSILWWIVLGLLLLAVVLIRMGASSLQPRRAAWARDRSPRCSVALADIHTGLSSRSEVADRVARRRAPEFAAEAEGLRSGHDPCLDGRVPDRPGPGRHFHAPGKGACVPGT